MRLSSVDVIQIDLAGFGLGDPAASDDDAHEGDRHRRGEDPVMLALLEPWPGFVAGHLALSA